MMEYTLNIGDLVVTKEESVTYSCLGLGSCVGLFLQDRMGRISGGAHILLPDCNNQSCDHGKYYSVVSAIDELINRFKTNGSTLENLRAKVTGGANVIEAAYETGERNAVRVVKELINRRVYIAARDLGGNFSRTARFNTESGEMLVRNSQTKEVKVL